MSDMLLGSATSQAAAIAAGDISAVELLEQTFLLEEQNPNIVLNK